MNNMHEDVCGCAQRAWECDRKHYFSTPCARACKPCARRMASASGVDFAFFLHSSSVFFLYLILETWENFYPTCNVFKAFLNLDNIYSISSIASTRCLAFRITWFFKKRLKTPMELFGLSKKHNYMTLFKKYKMSLKPQSTSLKLQYNWEIIPLNYQNDN